MKIAIVVHGRFYAFDLARALIRRGNDVTVLTNYPKWVVRRFGIEPQYVRSCWPHGVLVRAAWPLYEKLGIDPQPWLTPLFERWALQQLQSEHWDAIHVWSGVAETILNRFKSTPVACLLLRGSAHIRAQDSILRDEGRRTGVRIERPEPAMILREEREYAIADRIVVLSSFAYDSFIAQGVYPARVRRLLLGADTAVFRPSAETIEARRRRISSGAPLQVLYTGNVSLQKGLWDLSLAVRACPHGRFRFRCVGRVTPDARRLVATMGHLIDFTPRRPQSALPEIYSTADLYLFPTHQDGFPVVLAQANANGLPIIATTNCSAPDLIEENQTGWIVPIRDPQAIVDRLNWCDTHRVELANMVQYISTEFQPRDWDAVAADFERICAEAAAEKNYARVGAPHGR